MGSGGTEWETGDIFDNIRLNQKTLFVGNNNQQTLITSPQSGQRCFLTNNGTYHKDKFLTRNAANDTWEYPTFVESTEYSTGSTVSGGNDVITTRRMYGTAFTLPTTEKFYIITGIQFYTAADAGTKNYIVGVDKVDAIPPTISNTPLVALGAALSVAQNIDKRNSQISSTAIRGGTLLRSWMETDATRYTGADAGTNQTKTQSYNATPQYANNTSFGSLNTTRLKTYYVGYS